MAHFHDTSRTICDVVVSLGRGEGAWLEAIQIRTTDSVAFRSTCESRLLPKLMAVPGVCGAHLLHGRQPAGATQTAEVQLRGGKPDATADWILLVEAVEQTAVASLQGSVLSPANLGAGDAGMEIVRGLYRLQFSLSHAELEA